MIKRIDPPGCKCTDCTIGDSKPIDELSSVEKDYIATNLWSYWAWSNQIQDATGLDEEMFDYYFNSDLR